MTYLNVRKYSLHLINIAIGMAVFVCAINFVSSLKTSLTQSILALGENTNALFVENHLYTDAPNPLTLTIVNDLRDDLSKDTRISSVRNAIESIRTVDDNLYNISVWYVDDNFFEFFLNFNKPDKTDIGKIFLGKNLFQNNRHLDGDNHVLIDAKRYRSVNHTSDGFLPPTFRLTDSGVINSRNSIRTIGSAAVPYSHIYVKASDQNFESDLETLEKFAEGHQGLKLWSSRKFWEQKEKILNQLSFLILVVTSLILFLSLVGLASALSYQANERRREIGLRISLGATSTDIFMMFLAEGVLISILGGFVGIILGLLALIFIMEPITRKISVSNDFEIVTATSFVPVLTSFAILFLTSIVASISPALKASKVDPSLSARGLS